MTDQTPVDPGDTEANPVQHLTDDQPPTGDSAPHDRFHDTMDDLRDAVRRLEAHVFGAHAPSHKVVNQ
jgi:hypothetical protein